MPDTTVLTPELEEQLKQQAKAVEGLELEKIVAPRSYEHLAKDTFVIIPFSKSSEFAPADVYKDAVKGIAKPGIADKYLLLASYAKLAEQHKSIAALDFTRYTNAGIPEALEAHKEELAKLEKLVTEAPKGSPAQKEAYNNLRAAVNSITGPITRDNVNASEQELEAMLTSADAAYTGTKKTAGFVTPSYMLSVLGKDTDALVPDTEQVFENLGREVGQFVHAFGSNRDKKNYATGNRGYVTHFKTVKQKGKDGKEKDVPAIDYVEVYRKKAA